MHGVLTYASEGLRYAMVPTLHGYTLPTLGWVLLGLGVTVVAFSIPGVRTFYKRVVN
jgi:ABC-2 type transport system permease protein